MWNRKLMAVFVLNAIIFVFFVYLGHRNFDMWITGLIQKWLQSEPVLKWIMISIIPILWFIYYVMINYIFPIRKYVVVLFLPFYFVLAFLFLYVFDVSDLLQVNNILYAICLYILTLIMFFTEYESMILSNKHKLKWIKTGHLWEEDLTIMFIDIQDYTMISEKLKSSFAIGTFLNNYISFMESIILKYNWILDKIMGDGLMLVFRWKNKEINAVSCSMKILNIKELFIKHIEQTTLSKIKMSDNVSEYKDTLNIMNVLRDIDFNFRIWIWSWNVLIWEIWWKTINELTIIWDHVNLASRLESTNKTYQTNILCDENTVKAIEKWIIFRKIDKITVKGKDEPRTIYQPIYIDKDKIYNIKIDIDSLAIWDNMISSYFDSNFHLAMDFISEYIKKNPKDPTWKLFHRRIEAIINNLVSLPIDWDGTRVGSVMVK